MALGSYEYGPGGGTLRGSADPVAGPEIGVGPGGPYTASPEFGGIIGSILADQYARKKRQEELQNSMALTDQFSRLASANQRLAPEPRSVMMQAPQQRPDAFGGAPNGPTPIEQELRQKQAEAAIQALNEDMAPAPQVFNPGPQYTSTGYAPHYEADIRHMSANQRQKFLPQQSTYSGPGGGVASPSGSSGSRNWAAMDEENAKRRAGGYFADASGA